MSSAAAAESDVKRQNSSDDKQKIANRYRIEKKLSKDKNGNTYLVVDTRNNDELKVLKMVNLCLMQKNEIKETLREENILSKLDNPYIIKYYESFMHEDNLCIITEYCDGGDLDLRIKRMKKEKTRLPEQKIIHWFSQILSGAHYLHSKRVLHRNIKPGNIFIKNEIIKIGDFGISRMLNNNYADAQTFIGTPYYMSPEVVKNEPYNAKSDVWAIGCLLYEMCTHQHPFVGDTIYEVFDAIIKDEPPTVINLYSKELNQVIRRIFTKNAAERPSTGDLLKEPLISNHIKNVIMYTITKANEADRIAALANSIAAINSFINEEDFFGEYDSKNTIKK